MTAPVAGLACGIGLGFGSALLPLINAEAYVLLVSAHRPTPALLALTVLGLAAGQTLGKVLLFESGRRARLPNWLRGRRKPREPSPRWARVSELMRRPRTGVPLVLASAAVGLPPLAVVSVVAGASGQRRATFAALCFAGRLMRFAVLAAPLTLA